MKKVGNNYLTSQRGIQAVIHELEKRKARTIQCLKKGSRQCIEFLSPNGNTYAVTVRTKTAGTWQTSINYGEVRTENPQERAYWVFVDLGVNPPKFYPVPFWWISNDIHKAHEIYLAKHGGHRKLNNDSNHHAVQLRRIKSWDSKWDQIGLSM